MKFLSVDSVCKKPELGKEAIIMQSLHSVAYVKLLSRDSSRLGWAKLAQVEPLNQSD